MPRHLFTYGSLMYAAVWERIVKGSHRRRRARLLDHACFAVLNETYPGVIAAPGRQVEGIVYLDVLPAEFDCLDRFEGGEYRRQNVTLRLEDGSALQAETYLYCKENGLSTRSWEPQTFDLEEFLHRHCGMT